MTYVVHGVTFTNTVTSHLPTKTVMAINSQQIHTVIRAVPTIFMAVVLHGYHKLALSPSKVVSACMYVHISVCTWTFLQKAEGVGGYGGVCLYQAVTDVIMTKL